MKGMVFSIEEFSTYNGAGIRTTVFFKGCPLRCTWCHNPEGQSFQPEIIKNATGCLKCGSCLDETGRVSEKGIERCPRNLLRKCGTEYTSEELALKILKNRDIFNQTGGGVTFSGGEPISQAEFLENCLVFLKGKTHRAVQTSGFCKEETFVKILGQTDFFLYDLKIFDETEHIKYTGVSNKNILNNFKILVSSGIPFYVRIPLIPTVTDTEENIKNIAEFLLECGVYYAELLPYNTFAGSKYSLIGREYKPDFDESMAPDVRREIWDKAGIKIRIL